MGTALALKVRQRWQRLKTNKLVANASVYVSGSFIQRAAEFLLIPVWTRFLTPSDYGITGSMNAYAGVIFTILLFGLSGAVTRHYYDYVKDSPEQKSYIISVTLFDLAFGLVVTLTLDFLGRGLWEPLMGSSIPFDPYVRLMLWTAYLRTWIQIPLALYQTQQKARQYIAVQYGSFIVSVISSLVLVVWLRRGAAGQMWASLIAAGTVGLVLVVLMFRTWFTRTIRWDMVRTGLVYGLPLVPHALAAWALNAADRVILQWYVPLSQVGLYTLGYNLGLVMSVLVGAINQAWMPFYFKMMDTDPNPGKKIIRVVSIYVAMVGGLCLLGVLFAGDFIYLMLPQKYFGGVQYVPPVLLGYLFLGFYYFAVSPVFYYKKTKYVPFLTGFAAVMNIILNILLVPRYGALASAWVTTFTYGVLLVPAILVGQRFQPLDYPFKRYIPVIVFIFASIFVVRIFPVLKLDGLMVKSVLLAAYTAMIYPLLLAPALHKEAAKVS